MGKKILEELSDDYKECKTLGERGISEKQEIMEENNSLLQNNTTAPAANRPSTSANEKTSQIHKNRKVRVYNPDDRFQS